MATQTTNYNLTKPATTDYYDISVPNGNMDIIDGALKNQADDIAGLDGRLGTAESNITSQGTKLAGIETGADVTDAGNVGSSIHGSTAKTTPADNDEVALIDSAASNVLKKTTWANIKAGINADYTKHPGYAVDTGVSNAYVVTLNPVPTAYVDGMIIVVRISNTNTGTSTLNVNGLGAKPIYRGTASNYILSAGDLRGSEPYLLIYNSAFDQFILIGGDHNADTLRGQAPATAPTANTIVVRDASGRSKIAAPSAIDDIARRDTVMSCAPWKLIQSYETAGSYTFTAPDVYGDSRTYEIGVYIIGGGGSGGICLYKGTTNTDTKSSCGGGGASGYTRILTMTVTPGATYAVVVGSGGASVTSSSSATTVVLNLNGNSGGSSSFNGVVALGGSGGDSDQGTGAITASVSGGQGSDTMSGGDGSYSPAMGHSNSSTSAPGDVLNIFNLKRYLAAGGWARSVLPTTAVDPTNTRQFGSTADGGGAGGNGVAAGDQDASVTATATAGTIGCGGGGAAAGLRSSSTSYTITATSGKGGDGAVYIYARNNV